MNVHSKSIAQIFYCQVISYCSREGSKITRTRKHFDKEVRKLYLSVSELTDGRDPILEEQIKFFIKNDLILCLKLAKFAGNLIFIDYIMLSEFFIA
mgnify:CR=1 FL=1